MSKQPPLCSYFLIVLPSLLVGHLLSPSQAEKHSLYLLFLLAKTPMICPEQELTFADEVSREENSTHYIHLCVH